MTKYFVGERRQMETQGNRVEALRNARGWTLQKVADEVSKLFDKKVSYQNIQNVETGTTQYPEFFAELCEVFNVSVRYLRTGVPQSAKDTLLNIGLDRNLRPGPELTERVPVLSKEQAGNKEIEIALMDESDAESWEFCPVKHSISTYALRVEGDSMVSSHGDSFPRGVLIYVDPVPLDDIVPGDFVVARIKSSGVVTFKQLVEEDGRQFLRPLSVQSESIREPFDILGKVIWYGKEPGNF